MNLSEYSEDEINQLIATAPEDTLGDLLYEAVIANSIPVAKKILARQADAMKLLIVKGNSKRPTPVHSCLCDYLVNSGKERNILLELLQLLLDHNADLSVINNKSSMLDIALMHNKEFLIKSLLAAGANPNESSFDSTLNGAIYSIEDSSKCLEIMKCLLDAGADINGTASRRPLLEAARKNQIYSLKFLIDAGADLYATNEDGRNMLDIAIEQEQESIIDFCASLGWNLDPDQKVFSQYIRVCKNLDFPEIYRFSSELAIKYIDQRQMILFSYAATQLQDHQAAIDWAEGAIQYKITSAVINRAIAAYVYASRFSAAINCFTAHKNKIGLKQVDNYAKANLLVAALKTNNHALMDSLLELIQPCDSTAEGAGLLYFNAACICSSHNKLDQAFRFVVAARLNDFNIESIDTDTDLDALRKLPEFLILQDWKKVGGDYHRVYDNDRELWYFRSQLFEIDFAEQNCNLIQLESSESKVDKALAVCYALRDYEQQGNNPISRESAAINTLTEEITSVMMELLDSDNGENYQGISFEYYLDNNPLRCQWWAQGILDDGKEDKLKTKFTSYFWCDDSMYQALIKDIKTLTTDLFQQRKFFIQLRPYSNEGETIQLGKQSD